MEKINIELIHGDCLEVMRDMPDNSVDAVITDPPYEVTQNKADKAVDLTEVFRVGKGVVTTSQQPYTTDLIVQFRDSFKYDLIWNKVLTSGFLNANRMPLRQHEVILVFGELVYNPQKFWGAKCHSKGNGQVKKNENYGDYELVDNSDEHGNMKFPTSIITFRKPHPSVSVHRTQKPIELFEWLIKTYSTAGDTILDPFMGSGTTGVACVNTGRNFIGIEIDKDYYEIACKRIAEAQLQMRMF